MKIYNIYNSGLNEQDRLQLAALLIKAGYTVKVGKEKVEGKIKQFVEYTEGADG